VVLVSHSLPIIKSLCDRLVWIENGVTMGHGAPDKLIKQYQKYSREKAGLK
jgi:ABC-type polysaccharide/polyol phosphate transport system ATPase subunit